MKRYSIPSLALLVALAQPVTAQDPVKLSPKMYTVLLENDQVRVLEFRAKPGEAEPMHSHPAMTVYDIAGGRFRVTTPDGKSETLDGKAGAAAWSAPTSHRYENVGSTEVHVIIVETKNATAAPGKQPSGS